MRGGSHKINAPSPGKALAALIFWASVFSIVAGFVLGIGLTVFLYLVLNYAVELMIVFLATCVLLGLYAFT